MLKFAKTCAYLGAAWLILFVYDAARTQYVAALAGEEICDRFLHGVDDDFDPDHVHYFGATIFGFEHERLSGVRNRHVGEVEGCRYRSAWNWWGRARMHFWLERSTSIPAEVVYIEVYPFYGWLSDKIDPEMPWVVKEPMDTLSYYLSNPPQYDDIITSEGYFERRTD